MSVIAWDGITVAADRQVTSEMLICEARKLFLVKGYAVGFVGTLAPGMLLLEWFKRGAKKEEWDQEMQSSEVGSSLIVVGKKKVWEISEYPYFCNVHDSAWAWGAGREVALGAMAAGADALEAVEAAIRLNVCCGVGVDSFSCSGLSGKGVKVG